MREDMRPPLAHTLTGTLPASRHPGHSLRHRGVCPKPTSRTEGVEATRTAAARQHGGDRQESDGKATMIRVGYPDRHPEWQGASYGIMATGAPRTAWPLRPQQATRPPVRWITARPDWLVQTSSTRPPTIMAATATTQPGHHENENSQGGSHGAAKQVETTRKLRRADTLSGDVNNLHASTDTSLSDGNKHHHRPPSSISTSYLASCLASYGELVSVGGQIDQHQRARQAPWHRHFTCRLQRH
jgi:hypothetical protein